MLKAWDAKSTHSLNSFHETKTHLSLNFVNLLCALVNPIHAIVIPVSFHAFFM